MSALIHRMSDYKIVYTTHHIIHTLYSEEGSKMQRIMRYKREAAAAGYDE